MGDVKTPPHTTFSIGYVREAFMPPLIGLLDHSKLRIKGGINPSPTNHFDSRIWSIASCRNSPVMAWRIEVTTFPSASRKKVAGMPIMP